MRAAYMPFAKAWLPNVIYVTGRHSKLLFDSAFVCNKAPSIEEVERCLERFRATRPKVPQ